MTGLWDPPRISAAAASVATLADAILARVDPMAEWPTEIRELGIWAGGEDGGVACGRHSASLAFERSADNGGSTALPPALDDLVHERPGLKPPV